MATAEEAPVKVSEKASDSELILWATLSKRAPLAVAAATDDRPPQQPSPNKHDTHTHTHNRARLPAGRGGGEALRAAHRDV